MDDFENELEDSEYNGLPIYRYVLMMSRKGFTEEEFYQNAVYGRDAYSYESCDAFLKALISTRILEKRGEKYFFTIQQENLAKMEEY